MSIESKISTQDISIKDLALETVEQKQSLPFNAEKEITKNDWDKMDKEFQRYRREEILSLLPKLYHDMKILNPAFHPDLTVTEQAALVLKFNVDFRNVRSNQGSSVSVKWHELISDAGHLKSMGENWDPKFTARDWQDVKEQYLSNRESTGARPYWDMFITASAVKIINPQFDLGLIEKDWQGIQKELKAARKEERWKESLSSIAYSIKIVNPDFDLGLTQEDWKDLRGELNSCRERNDYREFAKFAREMKVIASPGLTIPRPGVIEFPPMPENISKPEASLPEIKKF